MCGPHGGKVNLDLLSHSKHQAHSTQGKSNSKTSRRYQRRRAPRPPEQDTGNTGRKGKDARIDPFKFRTCVDQNTSITKSVCRQVTEREKATVIHIPPTTCIQIYIYIPSYKGTKKDKTQLYYFFSKPNFISCLSSTFPKRLPQWPCARVVATTTLGAQRT